MKLVSISVRQRRLLHQLLHRDMRQCSPSALTAAERLGWISGLSGGYELTSTGRQVAERSERADPRGELNLAALRDVPAQGRSHNLATLEGLALTRIGAVK